MALQLHVGETVFSYGHFMFPTPVNGIVDTQGFLKAAEGINYFIDLFCGGSKSVAVGHPFNVVSALSSMPKSVALGGPLTQLALGHVRTVHKDVISHVALINLKRNLELVSSAYNNNPKRYATINEMVENELEAGEDAVIDALLWTKRCLHFGQLTMEYLVADYKRGDFDGDVLPHLKRAYKNALVKYHNILTTNSANAAMYLSAPGKREAMLKMCFNVRGHEAALIRDMDLAAESMKRTIRAIDQIYRTNGVNLETTERCIIL